MKPIIYLMIRDTDFSVHYYLKSIRTDMGNFKTLLEARLAVKIIWGIVSG